MSTSSLPVGPAIREASWKLRFRASARGRGPLVALIAFGALVVSALEGGRTPDDVTGLAAELEIASSALVKPNDVRWEPSSGMLGDLVLGRFVLFLGSATPDGARDVYRARVRLSPEGRPLGVTSVRNITSTPLGDDHSLVVNGSRAAYATFAFGKEQSVTALDLSGEGAQNATEKLHDRAMAYVTNVQQTGSGEGIGRIDVTLDQPAQRVGLSLEADALAIDLADDDRSVRPSRTARLDLVKGELVSGDQMHAEPSKHLPKRLVFWAVDTVRAVSWIGPAPIAWLEEKTFAVRDTAKQALFKASAAGGKDALAKVPEAPPAAILDTSQAAADLGHWPPPVIRSIWKTPEAGEGEWVTPKQPWIKRLEAPKSCTGTKDECTPPSPFYQTYVRPDEDRPYSKVLLVAMDMRQLDLDMEAGSEDPKPLAGPPGTGRVPRDPAIYTRIAAAFNGGFKTEHGSYGMMLKKRVLLPPMPGIATVILTKDGRVGMGSWGTNKEVGGIADVPAADIVSFRQNLDPLLDNDKVNPLGRYQWGFTLPGTSMQTERSGICITNAGHLIYAWGDDVNATVLGKAMKMASCVYGMHLDMNPHHTGLIFTNITDFKGSQFKSELLTKDMEIQPERYLLYAPKDFFYVYLHDPTPPAIEGVTWEPDAGAQPAPSWMAGIWRAHGPTGIEVVEIEPARASFRVRAGTKEPEGRGTAGRAHELEAEDARRVLFALTLGTGDAKRPRGLVTDGKVAFPATNEANEAMLVTSEDGSIAIVPADKHQASAHGDAVELPLLIDDGAVVQGATHGRSPAALGTTPAGRVFVARSVAGASGADLAAFLVKAGCTRAVLLDRGAGGHGALFRAGTAMPPRSRYDDTTLYAISRPLLPRGFRFEPTNPVEPPKKKDK